MVGSFEKRSATSFQKASMLPDTSVPDSDSDSDVDNKQLCKSGFHSPFGDWFMNPWLNPLHDPSDKRHALYGDCQVSLFLQRVLFGFNGFCKALFEFIISATTLHVLGISL